MSLYSSSLLEQHYISILNDPAITIVSFDIFDTLLLRRTSSHREVFEKCGELPEIKALFDTAGAFAQYRYYAEQSARQHHSTKEEIVLEDIYAEFSLTNDQKKRFQELELICEDEALLPNPQTDRWIKMAHDTGKKVILISDMYLSTKQIMRIGVSKLQNHHLISHLYISGECGCKKSTGNLFVHIRDILGFDFSQQLHIGDHIRSDVQIPHSFGVKTLHYALDSSLVNSLKHEQMYIKSPLMEGNHCRLLSALLNPFDTSIERFYFSLGALFFAQTLWEFSHWLAKTAHNCQLDQLHFLMREGDTFQYCFSKLYPDFPTSLIYASRQSTFLPSLNETELQRLNFHLYKALSIKDFYAAYHLPIHDSLIEKYQHLLCADANAIPINDSTLLNYFMEDFHRRLPEVSAITQYQKTLLIDYFTLTGASNHSALIDFGGGGTVLKRLFSLLPDPLKPKLGILFYQHAQGYKNLLMHNVLSFLPYTQKTSDSLQSIARTYDFIEILLNATAPTTLSYKQIDNRIEPEFYVPRCNIDTMAMITHAFRTGIDTFFSTAEAFALPNETYDREYLSMIISRLIDFPTQDEARYLGALEYDEGKGSHHVSTIVDEENLMHAKEIGVERLYQTHLTNPSAQKHRFPWIQGTIMQLSPDYLTPFFGKAANPNQDTIDSLLEQLDQSGLKKVMVYGAGELFQQLLPSLKERNIQIEALIDSRAEVNSFIVEEYDVVTLSKALENKEKCTIIIASSVFVQTIVQTVTTYCTQYNKSVDLIVVHS